MTTEVTPVAELVIRMVGEPIPQNQGKIGRWRSSDGREGATIRQPGKVRNYKLDLQEAMYRAAELTGWQRNGGTFFGAQALAMSITAVFSCPKSDHKKRSPVPRRPHTAPKDMDNLIKPIGDAGQGVLWDNDGQICQYYEPFDKWIAAQGEAPYIEIRVIPVAFRLRGGAVCA